MPDTFLLAGAALVTGIKTYHSKYSPALRAESMRKTVNNSMETNQETLARLSKLSPATEAERKEQAKLSRVAEDRQLALWA